MPINNKLNCVFFCGTAGAIRKNAFDSVGGWNLRSITEDSDLSVKLLMKGHKTVYLDIETPSEVPETFEGFIKQQMRWCYGNTRVFCDNASKIWLQKGLSFGQRLMVTFITLANITAPFVVAMTLFGFMGWFLGEPTLFQFKDVVLLISKFIYTGGFMVIGAVTLYKHRRLKEFKYLIASSLTIGVVLAASQSVAFIKALFNSKLSWYCTPKSANPNLQ
jgi:cellulose synthase/poly-beta-1,6-N-acetylglucosamine synthase-like glycosyltransferase